MWLIIYNKAVYLCNVHKIKKYAQVKKNLYRWSRWYAAVYWSQKSTPTILWLYFFIVVGQGTADLLEAPFWQRRTGETWFKLRPLFTISVTAQLSIGYARFDINYIFACYKSIITSFEMFVWWKYWHVFPILSDRFNTVNVSFKQWLN